MSTAFSPVLVPPCLISSLGSTANIQHRYTKLDQPPTAVTEHLSIDSAPEAAGIVPCMGHAHFVQIGEKTGVVDKLERNSEFPRIAQRLQLPEAGKGGPDPAGALAGVAGGDGAGGSPAISLLYLEESEPAIREKLTAKLRPFAPGQRAAHAAVINASGEMRRRGLQLDTGETLNMVLLASLFGGTASVLSWLMMLIADVARQLGIRKLNRLGLFTLADAAAVKTNPIARNNHQLQYSQAQLLNDNMEHPETTHVWHYGDGQDGQTDQILKHQGPFLDHLLLLPEPSLAAMEEHNARVGLLAALLAGTPLGKTFFTQLVNARIPITTQRGSIHRQLRSWHRINLVELKAVPGNLDLSRHAAAVLAARVLNS